MSMTWVRATVWLGLLAGNLLAQEVDVPEPDREGADWPIFLGPRETGEATETAIRTDWPATGLPVLWEKRVGNGYSAPSVRGNRLVLHHRVQGQEVIECFRADNGEPVWKYGYPSNFTDPYQYSNGPRCTPILTEDRCYAFGAEGKLCCVNLLTGDLLWMRDVKQDYDLPEWFFGIGCTPVLEGDLLIALVGGQPNAAVVAFNKTTGKTVWENIGQETWDGEKTGWPGDDVYRWAKGDMLVSYSSPIVATIHGKRHLLCLVRQGLVSLDPQSGDMNFKFWFRPREHESVNAARPVVFEDKIFLSAAYRLGSALLQVKPDGKSYEVVWQNPRNMLNHWSTSIYADGCIYGFSGRHENEGKLTCLDAKTGEVKWATTGFEGDLDNLGQDPRTGAVIDRTTKQEIPWPFYGRGSKIKVGDHFVALGERGTLALIKVNPDQWQELARCSYPLINYPAWTAPVLSRGRLYLRCDGALVCLDIAPPK